MNLIIAGCRDFTGGAIIYEGIDLFINEHGEPDLIIEGGATGVDRIAGEYAHDHNIPLQIFKVDWNKYGRAAGPIRNEEMAKYGTHLLAFWDGKSRGTKNMIDTAERYRLNVRVRLIPCVGEIIN